MTDQQIEQIQNLDGFLCGESYPSVTILYFTKKQNDMFIRTLLDPLMFLFQDLQNNKQFKINFNPTPEQMPAVRAFLELAQGRTSPGLTYTPIHKRLPNAT